MRQKIISYNPKLVPYARKLRNNLTYSEAMLWKRISNRQLLGYKFSRQKPIDNYIVDFYCSDLKLVLEIDGASHDDKKYHYDKKRENRLEEVGLTILRFSDIDIYKRIDEVLQTIVNFIEETHPLC